MNDTTDTLRAQFARLNAKSAKCWKIVACETAPMPERNAAHDRCLELDFAAGRIAAELHRRRRSQALAKAA